MNNSVQAFVDLAQKGLGKWAFLKAAGYILLFYLLFSFTSAAMLPLVEDSPDSYKIAILLLSFYGLLWGLYYAIVYIHRRPAIDAFTGNSHFNFGLLVISGLAFFLLCALGDLVYAFVFNGQYTWNFSWSSFLPVLIIALFAIPIQTTSEELLIRSYLIQSLSLLIRNRWMVSIISSLFFAILHGGNKELAHFGIYTMLFYYFIFGLFLAFVTIASNGLEMAMGIHAATNIYSFSVVSFEGSSLETDTLLKLQQPNALIMLGIVVVSIFVFLAVFNKKFNLNYFKSRTDDDM